MPLNIVACICRNRGIDCRRDNILSALFNRRNVYRRRQRFACDSSERQSFCRDAHIHAFFRNGVNGKSVLLKRLFAGYRKRNVFHGFAHTRVFLIRNVYPKDNGKRRADYFHRKVVRFHFFHFKSSFHFDAAACDCVSGESVFVITFLRVSSV